MKAAVYRVEGRTHFDHLTAMARGLREHGVDVEFFDGQPAEDSDFAVTWSWRIGLRLRDRGYDKPILVMERGYIGDRFSWTSLGWDGLNGRARFNGVHDEKRFEKHFSSLLRPWKPTSGYALIAGQVEGDTSLIGVDIRHWYRATAAKLWHQGWDVFFRQHPVAAERGVEPPSIPFAKPLEGSLDDAIAGAGLVAVYNSNTSVDGVLAGVPVHAADEGCMVYDLTSRDFNPVRPDREGRLIEIANMQWTLEEIRDGRAWDIVRQAM